jgi:small-conductance mechanosensitive channel
MSEKNDIKARNGASQTMSGTGATTNPKLSATLRAEYEALMNDVSQANQLAADFQSQLAGKSNELAVMKQVFEKTVKDLTLLEASIKELREERHRLANEAMRAQALDFKLADVLSERERLRAELDALRAGGGAKNADRDAEVRRLTLEVLALKQQLANRKVGDANVETPSIIAPEVMNAVVTVEDALENLRAVLGASGTKPKKPGPVSRDSKNSKDSEEFIDIAFER